MERLSWDLGLKEKYISGGASEEVEVGAVEGPLKLCKEERVYERGGWLRYRVTDGRTCGREGESKMRQRHERQTGVRLWSKEEEGLDKKDMLG